MVYHHVFFYEADLQEGTEDTDYTVRITRLNEQIFSDGHNAKIMRKKCDDYNTDEDHNDDYDLRCNFFCGFKCFCICLMIMITSYHDDLRCDYYSGLK